MTMNLINGQEVLPAGGAQSTEMDVVLAVRAAHASLTAISKGPAEERRTLIERLARACDESADELARAESADTALPLGVARADVTMAIAELRAAALGASLRPPGVLGLVSARTYVVRSVLPRLGAWLAQGQAIVWKPSSRTPRTAAVIGQVIQASGLPPGICNIVFGPGPLVGRFLVEHPGVSGIGFYGRTATGRLVMAAASAQLKRLSLNLSAKNAAIVLKDADLDQALPRLARAAFGRSGSGPFALSKILVAREISADFGARLAVLAPKSLALAGPDRAEEFSRAVALARSENGRVMGGEVDGLNVSPAIVTDLTHCSEIHQDELLIPLVTLNEVKYPHEGVKWANTSPFGRAGAIFTANLELGRRLGAQLEVGTAWINGWHDDFGGDPRGRDAKASGFGNVDELAAAPPVVLS